MVAPAQGCQGLPPIVAVERDAPFDIGELKQLPRPSDARQENRERTGTHPTTDRRTCARETGCRNRHGVAHAHLVLERSNFLQNLDGRPRRRLRRAPATLWGCRTALCGGAGAAVVGRCQQRVVWVQPMQQVSKARTQGGLCVRTGWMAALASSPVRLTCQSA